MSNEPSAPQGLPDDPTLTSAHTTSADETRVEIGQADTVAERVLSERDPLPFRSRFPLGGSIGKGGMAEVFLGRDRVLNRVVAVKVLQGQERDPARLRRFLREAQITAQLAHPNVVPVYGMENNGLGAPAFVMKCVEGETFKDYIERCRKAHGSSAFRVEEHGQAVRLEHFLKVCDAIAFAHAHGVIHRDIKPTNLMLGRYGEVYVMDWGIARVIGEAAALAEEVSASKQVTDTSGLVTTAAGFIGTPMYMPPEQAGGATDLDPSADQFALGMVLQELLTLEYPRPVVAWEEMAEAARAGKRRAFGGRPGEPHVAAPLRAVVERATQPDAERRYESVEAFAADVRRHLRGDAPSVYPDNVWRRVWRVLQRHPVARADARSRDAA